MSGLKQVELFESTIEGFHMKGVRCLSKPHWHCQRGLEKARVCYMYQLPVWQLEQGVFMELAVNSMDIEHLEYHTAILDISSCRIKLP